jgi:hypothetical protein
VENTVIALGFSTLILLALLAVDFLAILRAIKTRPSPAYSVGLFLLSVLLMLVVLIWSQDLGRFIVIATFNWGGFLFGLIFAGLGAYLMAVTVRDNKPIGLKDLSILALPAIVIGTGLIVMVVSSVR